MYWYFMGLLSKKLKTNKNKKIIQNTQILKSPISINQNYSESNGRHFCKVLC